MNELALFSGGGGGLLGGILSGFSTVGAVEIEPYRREVLMRRQADGLLPVFPIWDDVRSFDGRPWRGLVDIVTAGFPCQPFSCAGKRLAEDDPRNGWPHTIRIIREVGPEWCLLENVPGLITHPYFGTVLGDLAASGFDAEWDVISAADVGAPHLRERLWIVAHAASRESRVKTERKRRKSSSGRSEAVANPSRIQQGRKEQWAERERARVCGEPQDGRTDGRKRHLWPTPKASAGGPDFAQASRSNSGGENLATAVARGGDMTRQTWRSPQGRDYKNARNPEKVTSGLRQNALNEQVADKTSKDPAVRNGQLNPDWVEWLMGFPIGWTDLAPLEMDKFRLWQQSLLRFLDDV